MATRRVTILHSNDMHGDFLAEPDPVTAGIDGRYPPGLAVGTVTAVQRADKERFARIELRPAAGVGERVHLLVLAIDPQTQPQRPAEDRRVEPRRGARK